AISGLALLFRRHAAGLLLAGCRFRIGRLRLATLALLRGLAVARRAALGLAIAIRLTALLSALTFRLPPRLVALRLLLGLGLRLLRVA
ncbi:MAG: hypothetical protein AAFX41_02225, partial [Bacteroidota bacterium]